MKRKQASEEGKGFRARLPRAWVGRWVGLSVHFSCETAWWVQQLPAFVEPASMGFFFFASAFCRSLSSGRLPDSPARATRQLRAMSFGALQPLLQAVGIGIPASALQVPRRHRRGEAEAKAGQKPWQGLLWSSRGLL